MTFAVTGARPAPARADAPACALTAANPTPSSPSPRHPCWTDYLPYPFGFDGNPVDPSGSECGNVTAFGPAWSGDFNSPVGNTPLCYMRVTSMAFRAWNRGLAAVSPVPNDPSDAAKTNPFGVWLFNGARWYPDPTFPGPGACPGRTVLWAGKLDYWLIGDAAFVPPGGSSPLPAKQILCRFDGVNLQWEALRLPPATLARITDPTSGLVSGGIAAGACYSWDNCWFFGSAGIVVHWDGTALSDASLGPSSSPWLRGDFTAAVARTDAAGNPFGFAVADTGTSGARGPLPPQPDGTAPPELFGSGGGPFTPLPFSPPTIAFPGDPFTTNLVAVDYSPRGDGWVAGAPARRVPSLTIQPAPLVALTQDGSPAPCPRYDAGTFPSTVSAPGYAWTSLSVVPDDGTALAGGEYLEKGREPVVVHAVCGRPPDVTLFRRPDPLVADQSHAPPVPADTLSGSDTPTVVAANASNDAWTATSAGVAGGLERPHLYRWSDGQPPAAPAGDDNESRPTLFTLDAPVYVVPPAAAPPQPPPAAAPPPAAKPTPKPLPPAVYGVRTKLGPKHNYTYTLYVIFMVRRPVTIGVRALHGKRVVSFSGLRHFKQGTGRLALVVDPKRWPTGLRFVS
jgi:hypothetical protein